MFQNLRANNQLFILHKEAKHYVEIGSVVSVSAPKPKYPMTQPFPSPQIEMVVEHCCPSWCEPGNAKKT